MGERASPRRDRHRARAGGEASKRAPKKTNHGKRTWFFPRRDVEGEGFVLRTQPAASLNGGTKKILPRTPCPGKGYPAQKAQRMAGEKPSWSVEERNQEKGKHFLAISKKKKL